MTVNNSEKTIMAYQPGQSGNINGRPKGSLNKRTQLTILLAERAEELINRVIDLALSGDAHAMRLCVERLIPKARADSLTAHLPELDTSNHESSLEITSEIVKSVLRGDITTDEGKKLIEMIEAHQRRVDSEKFSIRF